MLLAWCRCCSTRVTCPTTGAGEKQKSEACCCCVVRLGSTRKTLIQPYDTATVCKRFCKPLLFFFFRRFLYFLLFLKGVDLIDYPGFWTASSEVVSVVVVVFDPNVFVRREASSSGFSFRDNSHARVEGVKSLYSSRWQSRGVFCELSE